MTLILFSVLQVIDFFFFFYLIVVFKLVFNKAVFFDS